MDNISPSILERVLVARAFEALDKNDLKALEGALKRGAPVNALRGGVLGAHQGELYQRKAPETLAMSALRLKKFEAWLVLFRHAQEKGETLVSTNPGARNTPAEMVWASMGEWRERMMDVTPNDAPILKCLKLLLEEELGPHAKVIARPAVVCPVADDFSVNRPLLKAWLAQCQTLDNREELRANITTPSSSSLPKVM